MSRGGWRRGFLEVAGWVGGGVCHFFAAGGGEVFHDVVVGTGDWGSLGLRWWTSIERGLVG